MVRGQSDDVTRPVQRRGENTPEKKNHTTKNLSHWASKCNFTFFNRCTQTPPLTPTSQILYVRNPSNSPDHSNLSFSQNLCAPQRPSATAPKARIADHKNPMRTGMRFRGEGTGPSSTWGWIPPAGRLCC